jgi:TPP-dependent indolepyruvate ferredoxin oxidoreductase alpha subunit
MEHREDKIAGTRVITGNSAAAYGAVLCRPELVAMYPITPQTEVVEEISRFHAQGELDDERWSAERLALMRTLHTVTEDLERRQAGGKGVAARG